VKIEVVLWDFGGVFTGSPFEAIDHYARSQNADPGAFRRLVFGDYAVDGDHVWHRLERGEISMLDAVVQIKADAEASGFRFDPKEMFGSMREDRGPRQDVIAAARAQQDAGRRNALLTNNVKEFSAGWRGMFPVDEIFAEIIDSSEVGMRKPDPTIYALTIERVQCDPQAIVFLDDLEENVEAGRAAGMQGIVVGSDPSEALEELSRLVD
jgi:putative hydrolase of the HAD superfamily